MILLQAIKKKVAQGIIIPNLKGEDHRRENEDQSCSPYLPNAIMEAEIRSPHLPNAILEAEILPRLHIKPLFIFKCFSKQYNSIISHPNFVRNYLHRLPSTLLFPHTDLSPYEAHLLNPIPNLLNSINSNQDHHRFSSFSISSVSIPHYSSQRITSSSNGLILSIFNPNEETEDLQRCEFGLCVSNPLTKQTLTLPNFIDSPKMQYTIATKRVVDSTAFLRYKVVAINDCFEPIVLIFSSDTGSWTYYEPNFPDLTLMFPEHNSYHFPQECPFSHQGVLYWLDRKLGMVVTYNAFDTPDRFNAIRLPGTRFLGSSLIYSGEEERVKYCETYRCGDGGGVDKLSVWGLVDGSNSEWCFDGGIWVQSFVYELASLMVAPNPWDRDLVCYPYVLDGRLTIVNLRSGTKTMMDVFDKHNLPPLFRCEVVDDQFDGPILPPSFVNERCMFENRLVPVELCPWSTPFSELPPLGALRMES